VAVEESKEEMLTNLTDITAGKKRNNIIFLILYFYINGDF